jgi:6-phosphogluconolactonase (cycloisomerase 2 family)
MLTVLSLHMLAACIWGGDGGSAAPATIGGTVSGLAGSGLVLADNGSDHLAVPGNGAFAFTSKVSVGSTYNVAVLTQPTNPSQTCVVANGSGLVDVTGVTSVLVTCTTNTYRVGGAVYGIAGSAIQLSDDGIDTISVNNDGNFVFPKRVASGSAYTVTITAQPTDFTEHCTVSHGIGTVVAANITNLEVRCAKAGRFVYITEYLLYANLYGNGGLPPGGVLAYAIDPTTGAFQTVPGSPFATDKCPCSLSVTPDGRFAYVGSGNTVYPYLIDDLTGALSAAGVGTGISAGSGDVRIDPKSKFAYVSDPAANTLSAYAIDPASGTLTPVTGSPFPTGANPAAPSFDPGGKFLYVANRGSNNISAYSIDRNSGALTSVAGSPFAASGNPDSVSVDAGGRFLYAISEGSAPQSSYAIDTDTGALSLIAVAPLKANPQPPANALFLSDPNSNRAYLVGRCISVSGVPMDCVQNGATPFTFDLWTFAIDAQSGAVSQSGAPQHLFETDEFSDLTSMQIDPSGKFVCARVQHGGPTQQAALDCYSIDSTTGAPSAGFGGGVGSSIDAGASAPVEAWDAITIGR